MSPKDEWQAKLELYQQEHLLDFWEELSNDQKESLLQQIERIDFDWVKQVFLQESVISQEKSIDAYLDVKRAENDKNQSVQNLGEQMLRKAKVAVLLVAGGAGTRLGFDGPKGEYPIGPISGHSLFQLHVERLLAVKKRYGYIPPLYIMTSPENHQQTLDIFEKNNAFGYPTEELLIFQQGVNPVIDQDGKLLLANKSTLLTSPNGNGGLFAALLDGGAIEHMKKKAIDHLSYIQIDNALANAIDPYFLGFHLQSNADYSCKAIAKVEPTEKVGNFALVDGRLGIVEYFELSDDLAHQKSESGEYLYNWGNPGIFLWTRDFVERQAKRKDLPVHKAFKAVGHIDKDGNYFKPEKPNGYKLETFALDTLLDAQSPMVYAVSRNDEFAPVKNASGKDSPQSARELMLKRYKNWLIDAGAIIKDDARIEISPLFAATKEEIRTRIEKGHVFEGDVFLK